MKLQEGSCCVAGTSSDFAGVRSLGDAEQQADHQIAPNQPGELLGKFGRTSCEQSGPLAPAMILRKAARLVSRPIELSAPATSGAWVTSEIASRNTAMTVGSLTSRTSF